MKMKTATSRKLRYGGVTAILTSFIIAAIIIFNVIFSALASKFLWYIDMTPELLFTLSEQCLDLIENGDDTFENSSSPLKMVDSFRAAKRAEDPNFKDEDLMIKLIFCDDPDAWEANSAQRYVFETAKQLEAEFPEYIKVENRNIFRNPSSVNKYGVVDTSNVIIEFGSEYRVRSNRSFYTFNEETDDQPWAYNGEKIFAAAILAVTRAETPIACLTVNHDETADEALLVTLETAGFKVQALNLASEEIPADCRLIVVSDPRSDFLVRDGVSEVDEIEKLDKFLDGSNSMMVFMSPTLTSRLTEFEDYLEEWGISFDRYQEGGQLHPYIVQDTSQSLTTDGYTLAAEYNTQGLGGEFTYEMRNNSTTPPMIVFQNAMSISYANRYYADHYTDSEDPSISFDFGSYGVDGTYRNIYDIFVTSENAEAWANGKTVEKATAQKPLTLMTVTREERPVTENSSTGASVNEASYVLACGSPQFASQALLQSNSYGNETFLEYALRTIGQEPVPVGLKFKPFNDDTIDTITTAEATQYTIVLTVVPAVIALGTGIFVIVRRKNR